MDKKVVVMSAEDVAAMRKAHKDAEAAYFDAKVAALKFAAKEMKETGKFYTVQQVAQMTGLTPGEIAAQFSDNYGCKAAFASGLCRDKVVNDWRHTERRYVEVLPTGEINPEHIITVKRREHIIKVLPKDFDRR